MDVYQTDLHGVFVGVAKADESPLEAGVFHIPGGCIADPPPAFGEGERARWDSGAWLVEPIPPAPEPPDEVVTLDTYRIAVQLHIDGTAATRNYDSGVTCASYVNSTIAAWADEAAAFIAWRDGVWAYALAELAKVKNGEREQPTVAGLIGELQPIEWQPAA